MKNSRGAFNYWDDFSECRKEIPATKLPQYFERNHKFLREQKNTNETFFEHEFKTVDSFSWRRNKVPKVRSD